MTTDSEKPPPQNIGCCICSFQAKQAFIYGACVSSLLYSQYLCRMDESRLMPIPTVSCGCGMFLLS